jgi:hypothetical protein
MSLSLLAGDLRTNLARTQRPYLHHYCLRDGSCQEGTQSFLRRHDRRDQGKKMRLKKKSVKSTIWRTNKIGKHVTQLRSNGLVLPLSIASFCPRDSPRFPSLRSSCKGLPREGPCIPSDSTIDALDATYRLYVLSLTRAYCFSKQGYWRWLLGWMWVGWWIKYVFDHLN